MATTARSDATQRTVVLLRPTEKNRLSRLAREQGVSASEIIRRSLHAYEPGSLQLNESDLRQLLSELNGSLDQALESARSARIEIAENIAKTRKLREEHA